MELTVPGMQDFSQKNENLFEHPTCMLPERFRPKIYNNYKVTAYNAIEPDSLEDLTISVLIEPDADIHMNVPPVMNGEDVAAKELNTRDCNEGDITQALTWIKSQLTTLKKEDKEILERFLEIRAKMNKLRKSIISGELCFESNNNLNSASDPSITDTSDVNKHYRASSLCEDDYYGEFRCRTVSMVTPKPRMTLAEPAMNNRISKTEEFL